MSEVSQVFTVNGTFTAPAGMLNNTVAIDIRGSAGGSTSKGVFGGPGGQVLGSVPLAPGAALTIYVGHTDGTGYQAGGAGGASTSGNLGTQGGGSSAVIDPATSTILVIAGAGGGGGGGVPAVFNGFGGSGGLPAGPGVDGWGNTPGHGGGGATGAIPGFGGAAGGSPSTAGAAGAAAGTGTGGNGGGDGFSGGSGGGGGGAGYTGGGGGGGGPILASGGGGGGGSSFAQAPFFGANFFTGIQSSDGAVTVTYRVADAPLKPTALSPISGTTSDFNDGFVAGWQYNTAEDSGTQEAYAFKRVNASTGLVQWWNDSTSSWVTSEIFNSSSSQSFTFPSGNWAAATYNVSVATQGTTGGLNSVYSDPITWVSIGSVSITMTGPASSVPSGTPTVSWTVSLGGDAPQTSYRGYTYTLAQTLAPGFVPGVTLPVHDTGLVGGAATSYTIPSAAGLQNHVTYVTYVQVGATPSTIKTVLTPVTYTLDFTAPSPPTLTTLAATALTEMGVVNLFSTPNNPVDTIEFQFSDDGINWQDVRNGSAVPINTTTGQAFLVDYEVPINFVRQYRARELGTVSGQPVFSLWTSSPYQTSVLTDSPLGFWPLDDQGLATVTARDISGNGNLGTIFGNPTKGVSGPPGTRFAMQFTPAAQYVNGPAAAFPTPPLTYETWVKPMEWGIDSWIMGFLYNSGVLVFSVKTSTGKLFLTQDGSTGPQSTVACEFGIWNYVAVTVDGSGHVVFYVNGAPAGTATITLPGSYGSFQNGFVAGWQDSLTAALAESASYGAVLSAGRIADHYAKAALSFTIQIPGTRWWMLDPLNPNTAFSFYRSQSNTGSTIGLNGQTSIEVDQNEVQGQFTTLGSPNYTVVHGDMLNEEFDLTMLFMDTADWNQFNTLRESQTTVCIKSDMEGSLYYVDLGPTRPRDILSASDRRLNPVAQVTVHCYPVEMP